MGVGLFKDPRSLKTHQENINYLPKQNKEQKPRMMDDSETSSMKNERLNVFAGTPKKFSPARHVRSARRGVKQSVYIFMCDLIRDARQCCLQKNGEGVCRTTPGPLVLNIAGLHVLLCELSRGLWRVWRESHIQDPTEIWGLGRGLAQPTSSPSIVSRRVKSFGSIFSLHCFV